jgi:hypothetical protein
MHRKRGYVDGHKALAEAERYTRAADPAKLATAAVLKKDEARTGFPKGIRRAKRACGIRWKPQLLAP